MTKYLLILILLISFSCAQKQGPKLELSFSSKNGNVIKEIIAFHLTRITASSDTRPKTFSFSNVKCVRSNKFVFNSIDTGLYIGLLKIEKNGVIYNISVDSIAIKSGVNIISKEVNLGTIKL